MISHLDAMSLGNIASRGGSLEVDGRKYDAMSLGNIASKLLPGKHLKVHNSGSFDAMSLGNIASRASEGANVIFC